MRDRGVVIPGERGFSRRAFLLSPTVTYIILSNGGRVIH